MKNLFLLEKVKIETLERLFAAICEYSQIVFYHRKLNDSFRFHEWLAVLSYRSRSLYNKCSALRVASLFDDHQLFKEWKLKKRIFKIK